jgi:two-component system sensor histidine kinase HydH
VRILQSKKMYLPAISIVGVVLLLLVIIGISTLRNLDRQEKTALNFLHRQALTLLRSLEAGARAGMVMPMWGEDAIRSLIQETGKDEDVAYVYLYDDEGIIVHHSDPAQNGKRTSWKPRFSDNKQVKSRVRELTDGSHIYEVAKPFSPFSSPALLPGDRGTIVHGHMMGVHTHPDTVIVLGLRMTAFDEVRSADLHHAVIMAAILLALGTGALFFIFVIQNYYLVDKALKQTQDYTAQVVANMANGLLSIDPQGRVLSFNRLALEMLGLEESKIKGKNLREVIDFGASGVEDTLTECIPVLDREIHLWSATGEPVPLGLSGTPILSDDGVCKGAVIILRDLREIKRLEEQVRRSEKLAAVGKLAAGVAHEIRNPLSSIRGFAQYLRHALEERPEEQEYAEVMVTEVDRINKVVTDLLTFSSPMRAEPTPTDIGELVEHTVRLVQEDARGRGVEIHSEVSQELTEVQLDANQMTQALLNLLLNAIQMSEDGGKIKVGADMARARLLVWVEDGGSGISTEHMDKIFDPFFTTRDKGTGLGLAIVHSIVENHHGEIKVESPPSGKTTGSRFTMSIPVDFGKMQYPKTE